MTLGQQTYVPDDNFEQALINLGYDNSLNDYVTTSNINTVTSLSISNQGISDLTGIEDFTALTHLYVSYNNLSSLDVSQNTALTYLNCSHNLIGSPFSPTGQLDLSQNTALTYLNCSNNDIYSLILNNGNNTNITSIDYSSTGLTNNCITVDDPLYSSNNWNYPPIGASGNWGANFSICCDNATFGSPCYGTTYVPDDNFEQALINLGYDNYLDNYVYTASIDTITTLDISAQSISDLTGIEDFIALTYLNLHDNGINGSFLGYYGQNFPGVWSWWSTINLPNLTYLDCSNNFSISAINTTGLPSLTYLKCDWNQITFLDLTSNDSLTYLNCSDNQLATLDVTNGNNINMSGFYTYNNSSLQCIDVDDPVWSNSTWTFANGNIDSWTSFSGAIINDTTVCNSYTWPFNGQTYTTSGTYTDVSIIAGCTHTGTLNLTTNSTSNTTTDAACDTYTWLVNGQTYTTSGTYTDISTNAAGCDHTETLNLTIEQNTSSYDTLSVGASIVWNGMPLNVSGDYSVTLINSVGCDSIVNLNLTVTATGISEIANTKSNLVKITDVLGQETPYRRNIPLFYIYDDGTVEKRIVIE
jgi:Leucine-rich repeat (LRR) protein